MLAPVNNAAVNVGAQIALWDPAFSSYGNVPRSRIAGSHMVDKFVVYMNFSVFFIMALLSEGVDSWCIRIK